MTKFHDPFDPPPSVQGEVPLLENCPKDLDVKPGKASPDVLPSEIPAGRDVGVGGRRSSTWGGF